VAESRLFEEAIGHIRRYRLHHLCRERSDVAEPGSGFVTVNCTLGSLRGTEPVAVSLVLDTNVVLSAVEPILTTSAIHKIASHSK